MTRHAVVALRAQQSLIFLVVLGQWSIPLALTQEDAEDRTVAAMCQAGLTTSAVEYVRARRELIAQDPSQSAKWTMRLMECHAFAALHARSEAESHWQKCAQVLQEFMAAEPSNVRRPWLQWQDARCDLLHTQADVALYLAAPSNTNPRELALARIRTLLTKLDTLEAEVKRLQPLSAREGLAGSEFAPAEQLAKLAVDGGLLRCEALLLRMRLYAPGSPDRIATATDVDEKSATIFKRTEPDWPSRAQLQVAQAAARLDLGQTADALRSLEHLAATANQRQARIRAATLAIEFLSTEHLSSGDRSTRAGDTNASLSAGLSRGAALLALLKRNEAGPESLLAEIQLSLAEAQQLTGPSKEAALGQLIAKSKQLGATFGDYWRSRAESLLVGSLTGSAVNGSTSQDSHVAFDLLLVEVRQLLGAGNSRGAIDRLLQFRDNEAAAGRGTVAVKVASQAAALWQREQAWLSAAEAAVDVCQKFVDAPGAAEAHLQAVFSISQALREDSQNETLKQRYEGLLTEQLKHWPNSSTTDEAETWLASWFLATGRHAELADAYLRRAIAAADVAIAERSLLNWLGEVIHLTDASQVTQQIGACAAARASNRLDHAAAQAEMVELATSMITVWPTPAQQAEKLLQLARIETTLTTSPWKEVGQSLRWLSSLRSRQPATSIAADLLAWEPTRLPDTIRSGLSFSLIAAIDETPVGEHAEWARRLKLNEQWQSLLLASTSPRCRARGYRLMAWSSDPTAALAGLKQLSGQTGRGGGELQLEWANALADSFADADNKRLEESSQLAKILIVNTHADSELHWGARWRLSKNQLLLGQAAEAQQAAQLLLATQPPTAEVWKSRFAELVK